MVNTVLLPLTGPQNLVHGHKTRLHSRWSTILSLNTSTFYTLTVKKKCLYLGTEWWMTKENTYDIYQGLWQTCENSKAPSGHGASTAEATPGKSRESRARSVTHDEGTAHQEVLIDHIAKQLQNGSKPGLKYSISSSHSTTLTSLYTGKFTHIPPSSRI